MDSRLSLRVRGAHLGVFADEAVVLAERLRVGETTTIQLLLMGAAGIEPACWALGVGRMDALEQVAPVLPAPSRDLFEPLVEQVKLVWELNEQLGWGFTASHFATTGLPTTWPNDPEHNLTAVTLVPYLDTVSESFEALWRAIQRRYNNHYRDSNLKSDAEHLKLLDGIVHPGKCLRWETVDMAANWGQEMEVTPRDVRVPTNSPHAGILAAGAIHKKWVEAMHGNTVPYVYASGYQTRINATDPWGLVPLLHHRQDIRKIFLGHIPDTHHIYTYAAPVLR